jgi:hypothetical protein
MSSHTILQKGLQTTIPIVDELIDTGENFFNRNFVEIYIPYINKLNVGFIESNYLYDTQNTPVTNVKIQIVTRYLTTTNDGYIIFKNKKYQLKYNPTDNAGVKYSSNEIVSSTYYINDDTLKADDLKKFTIGITPKRIPGLIKLAKIDPWNIYEISTYYKDEIVTWVTQKIFLDSSKLEWSN